MTRVLVYNKCYLMIIGIILFIIVEFLSAKSSYATERFFSVQSIDTMKYSRDNARKEMNNLAFDTEIDTQVKNIAETGATHIALGTPYDEEFFPYLNRWVTISRKYGLHVWFRGNFSGWEGWYGYPKMNRSEHIESSINFIKNHSELFQNGDIFVSCHECENGGPGDPRSTGDTYEYRAFLIEEYTGVKQAFQDIGKSVTSNYYSMNGDIARLIMDKETTRALDGVVTLDHYVEYVDTLIQDIEEIHLASGGKIILGEIGVPIPDIHGDMTEEEQAKWMDNALQKIIANDAVIGVNYWVNMGGSTAIWDIDHTPQPSVQTITKFFKPHYMTGKVINDVGVPIEGVQIHSKYRKEFSKNGSYTIPVFDDDEVKFMKEDFIAVTVNIDPKISVIRKDVVMNASNQSWFYKFTKLIISIFKSLWI